jgi:hypothetical protein
MRRVVILVLASLVAGCAIILAAFAAFCALTGCFAENYGTDGMRIWNRSSADVQVSYRRDIGGREVEDPVIEIGPNQGVSVIGLHQTEGDCLRGTLIATQAGRTLATLSQPCEGAEWVITPPDE